MNEIKKIVNIEKIIYEIRGKKVILDSDLALLYNVETKGLMKLLKIILISFQKDSLGNFLMKNIKI